MEKSIPAESSKRVNSSNSFSESLEIKSEISGASFNKLCTDSDLESNIDGGEELHRIYKIVEEVMAREKGLYPNTDYPIALLFYLLGIPIPLYTPIFFASRTAGLVAHVIEQHNNNRLFRPRVLYTGPRGLKI